MGCGQEIGASVRVTARWWSTCIGRETRSTQRTSTTSFEQAWAQRRRAPVARLTTSSLCRAASSLSRCHHMSRSGGGPTLALILEHLERLYVASTCQDTVSTSSCRSSLLQPPPLLGSPSYPFCCFPLRLLSHQEFKCQGTIPPLLLACRGALVNHIHKPHQRACQAGHTLHAHIPCLMGEKKTNHPSLLQWGPPLFVWTCLHILEERVLVWKALLGQLITLASSLGSCTVCLTASNPRLMSS